MSVSGAFFSSGATLIELLVQEIAPVADETIEVRIAADSFGASGIRPADGRPGVAVAPARPTIVRLTPIGHVSHADLHVSAIDVVRASGSVVRVSGEWLFEIPTPPDLTRLLHSTRFRGGEPASLHGITVRPVDAVTTTLETLVTVELSGPDNLGDLVAPVLVSNGETLYGARVSSAADGRLLTFAFPPLAGDSFELMFESFIIDGSTSPASSIDFELAAAMQRQQITGIPGESGVVSPSDIVRRSGSTPEILGFSIAKFNPEFPPELSLTVTGIHYGLDAATLVLSDGTVLTQTGVETATGTGAPGGATPHSAFHFPMPPNDSTGTVRLVLGTPATLLRGEWSVVFSVADG